MLINWAQLQRLPRIFNILHVGSLNVILAKWDIIKVLIQTVQM